MKEINEINSKDIDEIINKLQDEGDRLRRIGQKMIETANELNSIVHYYGHDSEKKEE